MTIIQKVATLAERTGVVRSEDAENLRVAGGKITEAIGKKEDNVVSGGLYESLEKLADKAIDIGNKAQSQQAARGTVMV